MSLHYVEESGADALQAWLRSLGSPSGPDTLLHFTPTPANSIDLTHAHPSGLAQLLAGRRTRLSTLLRDPAQYRVAMAAARALRARIQELGTERGIDVGYLAAGTASWRATDGARLETLSAPVLLTPVVLTVRSSQDDYELQLAEQATLNPALVRHLRTEQGIGIDPEALARLAYGTARFDPHPVLERLRALTANVRSMSVEHRIAVSTFADLADAAQDAALSPEHPVLADLMAAAEDGAGTVAARGPQPADFPPMDERDPADETLVLDADESQQHVLDLIGTGESLVVSAPPGTGQTQTAVNAIAALVNQGKSVLVVAERRATLSELERLLETLNLGSAMLRLSGGTTEEELRDRLIRAVVRNEKATEPRLDTLHATLQEHRHRLVDHVKSLHTVRARWKCSPYQAMQSLAQLTSLNPAPATKVRLKRSVLDAITDRTELAGRLRRAAELGSFSKASTESPWYGSRLMNRKETEVALELAVELTAGIPQLREKIQQVTAHAQIRMGESFREWGRQLELLAAVRASLDKFTPDIFDRPVTDLISATASAGWRRDQGIDMSSMTRSRLRRVAKEYVRPGVHIADLHASLVEVQQQRTLWSEYATTQRHPAVPTGLAELNVTYRRLQRQLSSLGRVLGPGAAGRDLAGLSVPELLRLLADLAADRETLTTLPERTLLLEQMRGQGLGELIDDLAARETGPDEVGAELELAWWQSALEAMISGDDYLAMSDGDSLRRLEAEYRLADNAHIASGSARLRWRLSQRWNAAISNRKKQAGDLRELLKSDGVTVEELSRLSEDLVSSLTPVWAASPLVLPAVLPAHRKFDTVILLDAESLAIQSAVPAISRARQVVAFGDGNLGTPRPFTVGVTVNTEPGVLTSAFDALARIRPMRELTTVYRSVDQQLVHGLSRSFYGGRLRRLPDCTAVSGQPRQLTVEYLPDGTGMPSAAHEGVEGVAAEVNRAVDLVFEHIRQRPRRSLAVITASERHAARVAEGIRVQLANYPWAADFFTSGTEPFRVLPITRAAGIVRDSVIFSLGFGRTPHGRALHGLGLLSAPDGRGNFLTAMTRARSSLHVLTCFRPEDLDPERLTAGAKDFYELINRELGTADGFAPTSRGENDDALVADLVERLRHRGAQVWGHFDGVFDIVAAPDPLTSAADNDVAPIAIESDGTGRYRTMSVRERSRLRPQMLERMGWRYVPLWTIEVFTDPEACADHMAGYLGLLAPAAAPQDGH